jgi:hypothetical protein
VHLWNPPFCGDLDMRIAGDGTWYYMGTPIGRWSACLSTILKRENGKHFLVTPVEKVGISATSSKTAPGALTVYGLDPRNALLSFGVAAGPVRNKAEVAEVL